MTYKSRDPEFYTDELKRAMSSDLPPNEFNARSAELLKEIRNLSTAGRLVVPRFCIPKTSNFLKPDNSDTPKIEDVLLFHAEPHQVYRAPNPNSRHTEPSRALQLIVKTSLESQVGYAFASPSDIQLGHYDAVFVPMGRAIILHSYTDLLPQN
jgi:hypothetical protein